MDAVIKVVVCVEPLEPLLVTLFANKLLISDDDVVSADDVTAADAFEMIPAELVGFTWMIFGRFCCCVTINTFSPT